MASHRNKENDAADNECINSFKLDTSHAFQKDRNTKCAPETGQWFFHHPKYEYFRDMKGLQILLVTAEAGGGKSTVMRTFIDRLQESVERPIVAYFFFKDDDDQLRSYEDALSSIVHQLLVQERSFVKHAKGLYKRYGHGLRYQSQEMWNIITASAAETQRDIVCVFDAADECAPAGRRQLVSDVAAVLASCPQPVSARLKLVVTSRPYRDENHPYTDLVASNEVHHLAGENAKVQSDVQAVVRFKAKELTAKLHLSQGALDVLVKELSKQNLQTRSFLAVRMAFELLSSHPLMRDGADEDTIREILKEIPESLGDLFDAMLDRSPDKEHARRIFCVILAARKTLKVPELRVLYALTIPGEGQPGSYNDIQLPDDDEEFKALIRARCGLFVTFVRSSVHLFHQTAREYLLAPKGIENTDGSLRHAFNNRNRKKSWRGCITESDANSVILRVCLDLFMFKIPRSWVLGVFDSITAGNQCEEDIKDLLKDKPLLQYAAFNWVEHATLGGDAALAMLCTERYSPVMDISATPFWAWFLVLADYLCSGNVRSESLLSNIWENEYKKNRRNGQYGETLRGVCLKNSFAMNDSVHALLDDTSLPLTRSLPPINTPLWTASQGYDLVDKFHSSFGDYQYTSNVRSVKCFNERNFERSKFLSKETSRTTMIWTSIQENSPKSLQDILSDVRDIDWLHDIPEYMMYQRSTWSGWSSRTGEDLRNERQKGWAAPCPPAFAIIIRATTINRDRRVFDVLANWAEASDDPKIVAQQLWDAGGFIEPLFCRRLVDMGISIDKWLWKEQRTALQIAAALWKHDIVETLISLGADPGIQSADGRTALHWFLSGPEEIFKKVSDHFAPHIYAPSSSQRKEYRLKSRIASTVKALCRGQSHHAGVTRPDSRGIFPLMHSSRSSATATKILLEEGAQVNQKDPWGRTAIMHYFCGEFEGRPSKILKHLLVAGADVLATDTSGHTVLQYWARQLSVMDLGSIYPGFNRFNKSFDILASTGALSNDSVLVQELRQLEIPLAAAVRLGNTKLCWSLLMSGADPNKHGLTKKTRLAEGSGSQGMDLQDLHWKPLLIALTLKAYATAGLLVAYGADVQYRVPQRRRSKYNKYSIKKCGISALHLASGTSDHYPTLPYIRLSTGGSSSCSLHAVGNPEYKITNTSPLESLARMQLEHWEQTSSHKRKFQDEDTDSEYEVPKYSVYNDWTGERLLPFDKFSADMLEKIEFDDPLLSTIIDCDKDFDTRENAFVEILLKKGAPVNARTLEGITPLAGARTPDIARILLRYGADPNIASENGCTPLMTAAVAGAYEMAEILLAAGANPNAQLNIPPLEKRACSSFIERYNSTFSNCDVPLTALVIAVERGHLRIVELLLKYGADLNLPITHHAHGRLPSARNKRRRARRYGEPESSDSDEEPEQWKGHISVGTALSWARDEIRELLLRNGADPLKEEPLRECDCAVIERRKERGWNDSDGEYPTQSEGEDTDAELKRHRHGTRNLAKWEGDTDDEK